jgi:phenylpropionate dioxygenase-like ring-hydroxylating dioxygenase large terminal subunit
VNQLTQHSVFNNPDVIVEGWYWACRSHELKAGKTRALNFLGKELVLFRGEDFNVRAMDAYCPHMGAHLAEGRVEQNSLRCLFHYWKFSSEGKCVEIPCQNQHDLVPKIQTWPVQEKYGLIWIWLGQEARHPVPFVPDIGPGECDSILGNSFVKNCHPNVVMINAIDAQHFNSVHNIPVELYLKPEAVNESRIDFKNQTPMPKTKWWTRFLGQFYKGPLTYDMSYWYGSTGSVTVGPDFLHFHIIFALRPTADGKTEGQTILVTKKWAGLAGRIFSPLLLLLTKAVGNYFAKGDTLIFQTIKFSFKTPIKADQAIISFIQHAEKQKLSAWGFSKAHGGTHVPTRTQTSLEHGLNQHAHTRRPSADVRDSEQVL